CYYEFYLLFVSIYLFYGLSLFYFIFIFIFFFFFFFFQAEDGIRDLTVTGVQTCALRSHLKQRLGHFKVMLEMRECLRRPSLQFRVVATIRIALKQRYRVLMGVDLHGVVLLVEVS